MVDGNGVMISDLRLSRKLSTVQSYIRMGPVKYFWAQSNEVSGFMLFLLPSVDVFCGAIVWTIYYHSHYHPA